MLKRIEKIICSIDPSIKMPIKAEDSLKLDLGLNSLDLVNLIVSIEEEFGVFLEDDELEDIVTIQDIIQKIV